jgi:hypothetical protein
MPSIGATFIPPFKELLRPQTQHNEFPAYILNGMLSPTGASPASIQEMDTFIRRFFIFDMPKNFFIQMAIAGAWICILFIIGNTCVIQRIRKKAFWLFRFQKRSEGTYVVPNALNSFLFFTGFFAILWISFVVVNYEAFWKQDQTMQYHIGVFNLIVWLPLWIGAFMAAWGSFYTAPGALEKGRISKSRFGRVASRPLVINIFCLGTPILLIASLLAPIILTQIHYNAAFNAYKSLHANIEMVLASTNFNQAVPLAGAQGLLDMASSVWQMQTTSIYYASIGYAIWSVWAGILLLFYIPAGGYLCFLLWKQLKEQKAKLNQKEVAQKRQEQQTSMLERHTHNEMGPAVLLFEPLNFTTEQDRSEKSSDGKLTPQMNTATASPTSLLQEIIEEEEVKESDQGSGPDFYFPPLAPAIKKQQKCIINSPQSRYKYLRRCFINLSVLYIGIVLGATLYLGVAASLAARYYESYLTSPQSCMQLLYDCMVVTAWGAVIFGTLTIFAILARFADPANPSLHRDEHKSSGNKAGKIVRFLQRSTSNNTFPVGNKPQSPLNEDIEKQQEKAGTTTTKRDAAVTNTGSGVFFKLRKNSGGIMMQPADTSLHAIGESSSVDMTEHLQSHDTQSRRRVPSHVPEDMTQGSVAEEVVGETIIKGRSGRSYSVSHPVPLKEIPKVVKEVPIIPVEPTCSTTPRPSIPARPSREGSVQFDMLPISQSVPVALSNLILPPSESSNSPFAPSSMQGWQFPGSSPPTIKIQNPDQSYIPPPRGLVARRATISYSYTPAVASTPERRTSPGAFF